MSFLSLNAVSHLLPDGTPLFQNMDFAMDAGRTGLVGRNGIGKSTLLDIAAGTLEPTAGTVRRKGTVRLLGQQGEAVPGALVTDAFGRRADMDRLRRALSGNGTADDIAEADWTLEERLGEALKTVGLEGLELDHRQDALSGGQRTRLALAALTFETPDLILLDEPTNNLDQEGRAMVLDLLSGWQGAALVVSHDRELLRRMDRIAELSSLGLRIYGGNWDAFQEQREIERLAEERALQTAEAAAQMARRQAQLVRERQERRNEAGRKQRARGDAPKILQDARRQRAEGTTARNHAVAARLQADADRRMAEAATRRERFRTLDMRLSASGLASSRLVLALEDVTAGYHPHRPLLRHVDLLITGPERIAVQGRNGTGKSTLLKLATGEIEPLAGRVRRPLPAAFLDQQAALLDPSMTIVENFRRINPGQGENACRSALALFLFRADAADKPVAALSGGERLRAGLACITGGGTPPQLLVLDEPTNHLDLDSIAAMETCLDRFDGALLVVSHDEDFLSAIGIGRRLVLEQGALRET